MALYPLAQQVAEKIQACSRDNTRVKDLDPVLLLQSERLDPERVRRAMATTFAARGTHPIPAKLPAPPCDWAEPYADLAEKLGFKPGHLPGPMSTWMSTGGGGIHRLDKAFFDPDDELHMSVVRRLAEDITSQIDWMACGSDEIGNPVFA